MFEEECKLIANTWASSVEMKKQEKRPFSGICHVSGMPCTQMGQQKKESHLIHETGAKLLQTRWIQNKTLTNIESSIINHRTIE